MKYNVIYDKNSPNPRNRWINKAFSNHQWANPLETKYATSNDAQATPLLDLWKVESLENDD